jgi:peptide/nickel transport system permease protein
LGGRWLTFVLRRAVRLAAVLAALVVLTFAMLQLVPGDPARAVAGPQASQQAVERTRAELGLDRSVAAQFGDYVSGLPRIDLGSSYTTREPVSTVIGDRLATTAQVALGGLALIFLIGLPLGFAAAIAAERGRRSADVGFSALSGTMAALPDYLLATLLAFVFAVSLGWLPVAGAATLTAAILPIVAISIRPSAMVARVVRVETQEVLEQDYVRAARSKRLRPRSLLLRHVAPNALTAALSVGGIAFATLVGGAVVVEQVFGRPGLGTALVQGIVMKDYPVVQGIVLVLGLSVVVVNAVIDCILALIDPRTLDAAR